MSITVTIDQQEIMELIAEAINKKFDYTKQLTHEDVVFEIIDENGNMITYNNVSAYIEGIN